MLPLLGTQPRGMPQSTNASPYAPSRYHPRALDHHQQHHGPASQFPRAFPIRTSQSHRRATQYPSSPYPTRSEHRRRKLLSEYTNAHYYGSSVRPVVGPQAPRILINSGVSDSGYYVPFEPHFNPSRGSWDSGTGGSAHQAQPNYNPGPWISDDESSGGYGLHQSIFSGMPSYQASQLGHFNSITNIYQPFLRANEYNVRAFCPPPIPTSESLLFGSNGWQPTPLPWHQEPTGLQSNPPNMSAPGRPLVGFDHNLRSTDYTGIPEYAYGPSNSTYPNMERLTLDPGSGFNGIPQQVVTHVPMGFKEKAIAQAHRSYMGLLAYMQSSRRPPQGKFGDHSQGPTRRFVYPKPPNPISSAGLNGSSDQRYYPESKPFRKDSQAHLAHTEWLRRYPAGYPAQQTDTSNFASHPSDMPGAHNNHDLESGSHFGPLNSNNVRDIHSFGPLSPIDSAKSSLEVLGALCEQSGWQWIDGILLGGCLHYALEDYQSALHWFTRITAINPSHVVAITDIAATLYCLGRQDEAERNWLKAVKLQPGYLEAVENLVGLLYRKRSQEAVEIITFVQQSLRLLADESSHSKPAKERLNQNSTQISGSQETFGALPPAGFGANGFGSSGYALPGSENGRILALSHAKGTMLYGLKDIDRASEAFEEAVLISIGRRADGIRHLVRRVQTVLSPPMQSNNTPQSLQPLLLEPERARQTARLVFPDTGELPGLAFVADGAPKRAARQTTSNSLLSLAKIFQDAMSSGSSGLSVLQRPSGVGDILALYYLSLSLQESPSTANNVGILLAGVPQTASHPVSMGGNMGLHPEILGVPRGSGLALALAYYQYGLRLDPKHVHLYTNLGSLLKDIGQLDFAIQMYEQAVSCDGTFDIALTNLANAVKDRGRVKDAIMYYRRAVKSNPDFAEAVCGLLTALNSVCDWRGRGGVILDSGRLDRWHVDDDGALVDAQGSRTGRGLTQRVVNIVHHQLQEASRWGFNILQEDFIYAVAQQLSESCDVSADNIAEQLRRWKGKPWEGSRFVRLAERATRVMLWKWYRCTRSDSAHSQYRRLQLPASLTMPSAPTVLPFHTFTCPLGPKDIRAISQRNALRITCSTLRSPWVPATLYRPPRPPRPQLNVGYVSSDFNNHPLAHLMQSVFGLHDPARVHAICYATAASDNSIYRQKIEREAPVFRDVSTWSPDRLVQQIVEDDIHILVNLNGYTRGARNEIFAARPSPLQVSFMGFAGSLGAEWCDYILADTTAIPPDTLRPWRKNVGIDDVFRDEDDTDGDRWVYSENIIFCRDTFFCCDHAQSADPDERGITWAEEQRRRWKMRKELFPHLSDDTVIMGNFNQLYKVRGSIQIEPTTFRSWLRILAQVPQAVLWLLRFPELGETNLRETAKLWAGPEVAGRLIFTDVAPKSQHISRARVCDLFLDTPECNAHTTAADVLWSSTPLLTYPRYSYKMCSRMASSILKGALPKTDEGRAAASELIGDSDSEYERKAITLAGGLAYSITQSGYGEGRGRLADIRKLLWESKWQCALFDTRRWVRDVETAYEEIWRRWVAAEGGDVYL
ncbi:UDP-N-acetylglucosaminyltransferase [Geosmithia morbida]|uniref:protein O-GlcNAc transferase n=1 Tax=Geosmithia morbida TaxID=1094350 RepID=A0A9P4YVI6_9HYPO|nr:UDP-N-acetylglucosaminyltransferase [Geosmithia morbida]KAF4121769.1 UDP-N-acetylglucosaminyltransferase [Geosmithia morbida]